MAGSADTEFNGKIALDIRIRAWLDLYMAMPLSRCVQHPAPLWGETSVATWDCVGVLMKMSAVGRITERGVHLLEFRAAALQAAGHAAHQP
ncbi:hypothetical protein BKG71_16745 [Mycobacteroides chelonae]|jgi:hypothetical protein|uniref:Uncharacterized protein n=1 Tax=Mycobacteroides chelonae TaxID=1774 RepID=A0AB73LPY8_MYCCH|nr:hypothetical protein BKG63_21950 [Mycobacteroides chelonae]OHT55005.1 hypothetical protein BKG62_02105 [Mycobacteroides chelonae]OHT58296.1 hypothetical protein BKG64_16370 [Mycobacteroides chelonae]OHT64499.1 hypothetical protein BKG65_07505 [Mycobacteroides chelonae]OHT99367.1 hypothetical protein BKG72_02690 [Mycobacteroides chelonae]